MKKALCSYCLDKMQHAGYKTTLIERGINQKITCALCGKRRYGGVYEIVRVGKSKENVS